MRALCLRCRRADASQRLSPFGMRAFWGDSGSSRRSLSEAARCSTRTARLATAPAARATVRRVDRRPSRRGLLSQRTSSMSAGKRDLCPPTKTWSTSSGTVFRAAACLRGSNCRRATSMRSRTTSRHFRRVGARRRHLAAKSARRRRLPEPRRGPGLKPSKTGASRAARAPTHISRHGSEALSAPYVCLR